MQDAETVLGILRERGRKGLPCEELYRQLFNPQLYLLAYGRIYANQGAMTTGASQETADGMSTEKIGAIIEAMRHERYRFTPVRRVFIPKRNGRMRPLGMPTWSDKLVGEVVRLLLEAYYEPQFSDRSHGFRPGRGCHTALREVQDTWTGTTWFIEGDISDCFGSLSHEIMLRILSEKIHDNRFLRLIRNMLKAGYLEDWRYHQTLSGCPQGGVVSPVLSNIYLHRLDEYVETVLIPQYTRGTVRKRNPEYSRVKNRLAYARKRGYRAKARELRQQLRRLPVGNPHDPDYRRLRYSRYADDHLLGFIGPKAEAEAIKDQLAAFLRDELALELNADKTLITHARTRAARYLGYEITAQHADRKIIAGQRAVNGKIALRVPLDVIRAKRAAYRRHGKPWHRTAMQNLDDYDIVAAYGAEYRGIVQYYLLATDVWRFTALRWDAQTSMLKTLACQAQVLGEEDGGPTPGQDHHTARAAHVLRSPDRTRRQAAAGRPVRRDTPRTQQGRGHHRPHPEPGSLPTQGAGHPAPRETVRAVRGTGQGARAPSPQPRQPRQTRASPAQVGGRHGQETAKDTRGLPPLPRPHPPRAARRRSGVDRWRATCTERCPRGSAGGRAEKDLPSRHLAARPTQWKAANSFFYPGDPAARAWVKTTDRQDPGRPPPRRPRRHPPPRHHLRLQPRRARRRRRMRRLPRKQAALPGLPDRVPRRRLADRHRRHRRRRR